MKGIFLSTKPMYKTPFVLGKAAKGYNATCTVILETWSRRVKPNR